MKKLTLVLCMFVAMISNTETQAQKGKKKADKQTVAWRYEIEAVGVGVQGSYQIKVWSYSKHPETAIEQGKKNAVHGIIFKGFPANNGAPGQKPLATDPMSYDEHKKFYDKFFTTKTGDYMKFVTLANNGEIAAGDRIKIKKKEYKVGVVISVNVAGLRKYLEKEGVIKGLSSGF